MQRSILTAGLVYYLLHFLSKYDKIIMLEFSYIEDDWNEIYRERI